MLFLVIRLRVGKALFRAPIVRKKLRQVIEPLLFFLQAIEFRFQALERRARVREHLKRFLVLSDCFGNAIQLLFVDRNLICTGVDLAAQGFKLLRFLIQLFIHRQLPFDFRARVGNFSGLLQCLVRLTKRLFERRAP